MYKSNCIEKAEKEFPEFTQEIHTLTEQQLNDRLAQLAKYIDEVDESAKNDDALVAARENVTLLSGPHRDAKKALKLKTKYIIETLKDRGAK